MQQDPRDVIDQSPIRRPQIMAIAVTVALSALDGFDVLSVTFAAPGITQDWGVTKGVLGLVFSSGLLGMALGSLFLAPLADVVGRRRMVLASLAIMTVGMGFCAFSNSVSELSAWRVVTGVGIGAMVAVINPLVVEFSNVKRRALAVGFMAIGYPIGGVIGGFISAILLRHFDWPSVFLLGVAMAVLLTPFVLWLLPESLAYLMERRDGKSLERVNTLLARLGHKQVSDLPPPEKRARVPYAAIFAKDQIAATLQVTAVNFLFVMTVYYFLSWLPQMVADAGYSASTATTVSATANLVGIAGAVVLGLFANLVGLRLLVSIAMLGFGAATAIFGFVRPELAVLTAMASIAGAFLFAGIAGIFTTIGATFAPHMRATGTGFVIGVGRGGSALAPAIAGALFAVGASRGEVSLALGACAFVAGLLLLFPARKGRPPA